MVEHNSGIYFELVEQEFESSEFGNGGQSNVVGVQMDQGGRLDIVDLHLLDIEHEFIAGYLVLLANIEVFHEN